MHTNPTRIRRGPIIAALVVVAIMLGGALVGIAQAVAGEPSKCGAQATGIDRTIRTTADPNGRVVSGAFPRRWVDASGVWRDCQPWVPDGGDPAMPEPPTPLQPCQAETTYRTWEVAGLVCTSTPPGDSTATTLMLPRTEPGRVALLRDDHGAAQGLLVMRCAVKPDRSTRWDVEGMTCGLVPQVAPAGMCSAQTIGYVTSRTRPATAYTYSDEPVRQGIRVPVRAADGTVRVARCGALGRLEW